MSSIMRILPLSKRLLVSTRSYSTPTKLVDVKINDKTGVATATMQRKPVNSMNQELITELTSVLGQLESQKARGLILTSGLKTVFSGGLDLLEMYKPDLDKAKQFWTGLQNFWIKLYSSPFPTAAAINGHSPAGGCLMAISCEYRVMVNNFTIGLNETQLGIVAPFWFVDSYKNVLGIRQTELALTTGRLFTTEEALKVGLVDEVAADKDDAIAKCEAFLAKFAKISPLARSNTKMNVRGDAVKNLVDRREEDLNVFISYITQPKVQKGLELYLQALKAKSS